MSRTKELVNIYISLFASILHIWLILCLILYLTIHLNYSYLFFEILNIFKPREQFHITLSPGLGRLGSYQVRKVVTKIRRDIPTGF